MMTTFSAVEDAIIAVANAKLPNKLNECRSLPGSWSVELLKQLLQRSPSVYVSFLGGDFDPANPALLNGVFDVYFVQKDADEATRRRGNSRAIGCYDMMDAVIPFINGLTVPGVGSLRAKSVKNLFAAVLQDLGGSVYAVSFTLPRMPLGADFDPSTLHRFLTFHAESDINGDHVTDFITQFDLPQG